MAVLDYQHLVDNHLSYREAHELLQSTLSQLSFTLKLYDAKHKDKSGEKYENVCVKAIAFLNCEIVETCMVLIEEHLDNRGYRVINVKHPVLIENYGKAIKKHFNLSDKELETVDTSLAYLVQLNRMRNKLIHKEYKNLTEQNRIQDDLLQYLKAREKLLNMINLVLKYHVDRLPKLEGCTDMRLFN